MYMNDLSNNDLSNNDLKKSIFNTYTTDCSGYLIIHLFINNVMTI